MTSIECEPTLPRYKIYLPEGEPKDWDNVSNRRDKKGQSHGARTQTLWMDSKTHKI